MQRPQGIARLVLFKRRSDEPLGNIKDVWMRPIVDIGGQGAGTDPDGTHRLRDHIAEEISDAKRFGAVSLPERLDLVCIDGVADIELLGNSSVCAAALVRTSPVLIG
jgi:hypothetical protein